MIVDRMIHLALCGHAVSVVSYLIQCVMKRSMDTSLVRHFVHEVSIDGDDGRVMGDGGRVMGDSRRVLGDGGRVMGDSGRVLGDSGRVIGTWWEGDG